MIDIRMAEDEADAILAYRAYARMHAEGGVPGANRPLNHLKTLTNVLRMVKGPNSAVIMAMDGDNLAGVLSLVENTYWFGDDDDRFLIDKGLYVAPDYRGGDVLKMLLDAAVNLSDDTGLPVYVTINNLKRRRGAGSKWERIGATLGYINQGAMMAHIPET